MSDDEFLRAFEDGSLPFAQWTHRAHVKIAFLYSQRYPFDDALAKIRSGIRSYNAVHAVRESATTGYNETTTTAMMRIVAATIAAYGVDFPTSTADEFCDTHPQLMSKHVLRLFYSPGRRMHPNAKTEFVEPDLTDLPRIPPGNNGETLS